MSASHHEGEINYYEELGVAPDASPDAIRDAFRLYVRLLHPDQQIDAQLKEVAEAQMRKLNHIYAVLSEPESRRRYDRILEEEYPAPIVLNVQAPHAQSFLARLSWAGAIVLSAMLLVWLATSAQSGLQGRGFESAAGPNTSNSPAPVPGQPSDAAPVGPAGSAAPTNASMEAASQIAQLQADLHAVILERDAAVEEANKLRRAAQALNVAPSAMPDPLEPRAEAKSSTAPLAELASPPRTPAGVNPVALRAEHSRVASRAESRQLAGFWFYSKPPQGQINRNKSLYPPEYIEATIAEEDGMVRGSLRSRFQIADRAISPDVNFFFAGMQNRPQTVLNWTGPGGSKGELTLKLTSDNTLRIDWTASEVGTQLGLSSGTATLTRRIE